MPGFFFLFEIEGKEKEDDADGLVGDPLAEALEPVVVVKVVRRIDLDAMVADDLFEVCFDAGGKFVIAYIHVEFYAGVRADPVDIIGSVGHPYSVVGGHFAMQDGSLVFIDFDPVAEKPLVHVLFGKAGNLDIGDGADDDTDAHAAACGLGHLFAEDGTWHKIGG